MDPGPERMPGGGRRICISPTDEADRLPRNYFVYIMASRTRRLYVGVTGNLPGRVTQHKNGAPHSFTARYNINRLVYFEHTTDARAAIAREKQLKGWNRSRKIALIAEENPTWADLSLEPGFYLPT